MEEEQCPCDDCDASTDVGKGAVLTIVLIATHMPQQMYLAAGWILLNSII